MFHLRSQETLVARSKAACFGSSSEAFRGTAEHAASQRLCEGKPKMQRLLSKEKLQMEWKVQRQVRLMKNVSCSSLLWPLKG